LTHGHVVPKNSLDAGPRNPATKGWRNIFLSFLLQCGKRNDKLSPIEVFEIAFPLAIFHDSYYDPPLMVGALDGLYWSRALGFRFTMVYHMITMNLLATAQVIYAFVAFSSFVSAMTNATNELRAFTRLGRNAMGGCPK